MVKKTTKKDSEKHPSHGSLDFLLKSGVKNDKESPIKTTTTIESAPSQPSASQPSIPSLDLSSDQNPTFSPKNTPESKIKPTPDQPQPLLSKETPPTSSPSLNETGPSISSKNKMNKEQDETESITDEDIPIEDDSQPELPELGSFGENKIQGDEVEHGIKLKKRTDKKKSNYKKEYYIPNTTPFGEAIYPFDLPRKERESAKSQHWRYLEKADMITKDMAEGILLTVDYEGYFNKAVAKFYDIKTNSIKFWVDTTNHRPYCYHKASKNELETNESLLDFPGFVEIQQTKKYDLLQDKEINVSQIFGNSPTAIGGANSIRELLGGAWEANIRYHHNYIYDRNLVPGLTYKIEHGNVFPIEPDIDKTLEGKLIEVFKDQPNEEREIAELYHSVFSASVPNFKRLAFDIEVEETEDGLIPDPLLAKYAVISMSFAATDGLKLVYVLDRDDIDPGEFSQDFPKDAKILFFEKEKELLQEAFRIMWEYPLIITFNGDNFDNTYLFHRAKKLKIDEKLIPIVLERGGGGNRMVNRETDYKNGVHIELFQFFSNRSLKVYAFGGAYLKNSLEEISTALLGKGKIKHEEEIGQMTLADLIYYNLTDSMLTLELTTYSQQLVISLLIILMRITKLPLQDIFRVQISAWVRSLLFYEHRRKNYLIPRESDLEGKNKEGFSQAGSEGKGFQGAFVINPKAGIHFDVSVMDFSSLYPSIIKTRNLSYETVLCAHPTCKKNMLPNTPYWYCSKRMGIFAYVVGYLRDIRVKWYKPLSGNKSAPEKERQLAKVMQSALKVFINGAYGVFGSNMFALFCLPVAESTTAIGRFSIQETIKKAESLGITVLYGDSDSIFLLHPPKDKVEEIIKWAEINLDLDLELEKTYQFLALSERKKNYIGVKKGSGEVDIKGLLAKKHNTPEFIKVKFAEVVKILREIVDEKTFAEKKAQIIAIIRETNRLIGKPIEKGGFKIEDYAINIVLQRKLKMYVKNIPQHIRAARMLSEQTQKKLEPGAFISFIKARSKEGVKPVEMANLDDLDVPKYKEMVQSTFEQILDALNIDYEEIMGATKLTSFFK